MRYWFQICFPDGTKRFVRTGCGWYGLQTVVQSIPEELHDMTGILPCNRFQSFLCWIHLKLKHNGYEEV